MASPHLADQVGRVLDGRYRVVAPIGTGASAAVFLADDVVLRRRVALKILHAALATDQAFLKRFQAEAHTAAGLSHPNVMRVLDWGEADDGPILVLEYLGGGSLRSVLDESGTLTVEQAVSVGLQAARALDYAHRRGLVHRDVKPANLLFDDEGRLAIADFGLARALAEAAWTEPGGAVLGTARYASPEQVRGQSLDGKSDIYALGLVLIEAVCGYVPFTADTTIATLMARLDVHLEAPSEMGPLGAIVEKATNPEPTDRIDAAALVALLEEATAQLPVPAKIPLPGAIHVDTARLDSADPTMLPGGATMASSAGTNPSPGVPEELRTPRRPILRRRKAASATPAAGVGAEVASGKKSRKRRVFTAKRLGLTALILILVGSMFAGGYAFYFYTGKEHVVPQLDGLTLGEARAVARESSVRLSFDGQDFSETVPPGVTFQSTPNAGGKVHERESVHLKVSKGPAPRDVTDTTGQSFEEARRVLSEKGFQVTSENRYDEVAPVGKVLSQDPAAGQRERGSEIHLVLSKGPEPRPVVDLTGRTYEEAAAELTARQLKVVKGPDAFSDTVPVGQVASTSPAAGGTVPRGGTVTINVSKGPNLVAVPNVRGKTVAAATQALSDVGLNANNVFGPAGGTVFDTEATPGTKVKIGANVSLYTR